MTGGKVIGNVDAVKASGLQTNDDGAELMMLLENLGNHQFHLFSAILRVWDGGHPNEELLLEVQSRDNV